MLGYPPTPRTRWVWVNEVGGGGAPTLYNPWNRSTPPSRGHTPAAAPVLQ